MNAKELSGRIEQIVGTALGRSIHAGITSVRNMRDAWRDNEAVIHDYCRIIEEQGSRFTLLNRSIRANPRHFDAAILGGELVGSYLLSDAPVPEDVLRAYSMAFPEAARHYSFAEALESFKAPDQLQGFVSAVKGKLFELQYVDHLNSGALPDGFTAHLAESSVTPGWDIKILDPDGHVASLLQAKATESASYVKEALLRYPEVDVVTTSEVHAQLVMQGAGARVSDSGFLEHHLDAAVLDAASHPGWEMDWTPPLLTLCCIAFTSFRGTNQDIYQQAASFGSRAGKVYVARLIAMGGLALSQSWIVGVAAGVGSRYLMERGARKNEALASFEDIILQNKTVLQRLENLTSTRRMA